MVINVTFAVPTGPDSFLTFCTASRARQKAHILDRPDSREGNIATDGTNKAIHFAMISVNGAFCIIPVGLESKAHFRGHSKKLFSKGPKQLLPSHRRLGQVQAVLIPLGVGFSGKSASQVLVEKCEDDDLESNAKLYCTP